MIGGVYAAAMAWAIIPHYGEQPPGNPPQTLSLLSCGELSADAYDSVPARVEFSDGFCLPVPQLEGLCPRLRLSICVCHWGSDNAA